MNAGQTVNFCDYKIKAIDCAHDRTNGSLLYVISSENKNVLYATDTPELTEEALEQLAEYKLDLVIMDHTFGGVEYSFSHLNEKKFVEQISRMKERNIIGEETLIYGTHISHDGMPYHEEAEKKASSLGYHIAWDGMEVEV